MKVPDRQFRLSSARQIGELFRSGARHASGRLMLLARPNELGHNRLAVAVGGRHGNAVRRNRVKRLCREAFRAVRDRLPQGWDLVLVPRPREDHTLENLTEGLLSLGRRLKNAPPADSPAGREGQT